MKANVLDGRHTLPIRSPRREPVDDRTQPFDTLQPDRLGEGRPPSRSIRRPPALAASLCWYSNTVSVPQAPNARR
jgi:hypothetical protein